MNPILLQKQLRDNSKDLQDFYKELQEWGDEMKRKEKPSEPSTEATTSQNKEDAKENSVPKSAKRIRSYDYKAWDKFDADAYCKKMDKEDVGEAISDESDDLSDEMDGSMVEIANSEKEKGNAFVKKQRWNDAIKCYTQAIEYYAYDPIYYANRALCHLKTQNYRNAESDCTTALQLDKKYVKAYQRRAAAREALNQLSEAQDDLLRVLELETKNTESKAALVKLEKKMEAMKQPVADTPRPVSKFTLSRHKQKLPVVVSDVKSGWDRNEEIAAVKERVVENVQAASKTKVCRNVKSYYWPSGNDVELFESLPRPKARSNRPLKRIEIVDVDLQSEEGDLKKEETETKIGAAYEQETLKILEEIAEEAKKIAVIRNENVSEKNEEGKIIKNGKVEGGCKKIEGGVDEIEKIEDRVKEINGGVNLPPVPKTSIQFYNGWKSTFANQDLRYQYMKQINPKELPEIFRESLESKIFSEMIQTLSSKGNSNFISAWLTNLTNVKRFSALIMFMSAADKKLVSELITNLGEENKFKDTLLKKYEL